MAPQPVFCDLIEHCRLCLPWFKHIKSIFPELQQVPSWVPASCVPILWLLLTSYPVLLQPWCSFNPTVFPAFLIRYSPKLPGNLSLAASSSYLPGSWATCLLTCLKSFLWLLTTSSQYWCSCNISHVPSIPNFITVSHFQVLSSSTNPTHVYERNTAPSMIPSEILSDLRHLNLYPHSLDIWIPLLSPTHTQDYNPLINIP